MLMLVEKTTCALQLESLCEWEFCWSELLLRDDCSGKKRHTRDRTENGRTVSKNTTHPPTHRHTYISTTLSQPTLVLAGIKTKNMSWIKASNLHPCWWWSLAASVLVPHWFLKNIWPGPQRVSLALSDGQWPRSPATPSWSARTWSASARQSETEAPFVKDAATQPG